MGHALLPKFNVSSWLRSSRRFCRLHYFDAIHRIYYFEKIHKTNGLLQICVATKYNHQLYTRSVLLSYEARNSSSLFNSLF